MRRDGAPPLWFLGAGAPLGTGSKTDAAHLRTKGSVMTDKMIHLDLTPDEARGFLQIVEGTSQMFLREGQDLGATESGRRLLALHRSCQTVAAQLRQQGVTRLDGLDGQVDSAGATITPLFRAATPEIEPDTPETVARKMQGLGAALQTFHRAMGDR